MSSKPRPSGGSRRSSARRVALVLLLYAGLAVGSTWPLARDLGGQVPRGTLESTTIPLVSAWALWWTADRLPAGFASYWDAPILQPAQDSFALSEPMPLVGVVAAPLVWMGASPVLAYALVLLLALVSNGAVTFGLLRALPVHPWAAAAGGAIAVVLPYTQREVGVLTLVPLAGIVGTLWALLVFARRPSVSGGAVLGAVFGATYLVCAQHAVFLALALLPAGGWLLNRGLMQRRALLAVGVAFATAAALVTPVALAQIDAFEQPRGERTASAAVAGSAHAGTWWAAPWRPLLPVPGLRPAEGVHRRGLFPGAVKLVLALGGLAWALRRREHRRVAALLATLAVGGLALSMLPRLVVGDVSLYAWAREALPGLAQIRSFYRAGVLVHVAIALLAGWGLHAVVVARSSAKDGRPGRVPAAVAIGLAVVAVIELWPVGQGFSAAPDFRSWRPFVHWVERNVAPEEAMAYFPFFSGGRIAGFEDDARWMVLQSGHGRAMVNGYSSYMPETRRRFARGTREFPDAASHAWMRQYGVRWVVVDRAWLGRAKRAEPAGPGWRRAHELPEHDLAIYEVLVPPGAGGGRGSARRRGALR